MNNIIYLTPSFDFLLEPKEPLAEVKINNYTNFGNEHISFKPLDNHGYKLSFSGWLLDEFFVNKQWNESYVVKLRVSKNGLPICDLHEAYRLLAKIEEKRWINSHYEGLTIYSAMFQDCIKFLDSIPEELESAQSVYQYTRLYTSNTKSELVNFYKFFIDAKSRLNEVEIRYIEEIFLQKLSHILLT